MGNLEVGALSSDDKFSAAKGLFVAAALTAYDSVEESIEEPRFGELVIEHYEWGNGGILDNSGVGKLDNYACSEEELGLVDDESSSEKFRTFPIYEGSRQEVKIWKNKFKCVDREQQVIWGDYNSVKAQQIAISFKMCQNETYCESKETILEWLQGKYIVLVYN